MAPLTRLTIPLALVALVGAPVLTAWGRDNRAHKKSASDSVGQVRDGGVSRPVGDGGTNDQASKETSCVVETKKLAKGCRYELKAEWTTDSAGGVEIADVFACPEFVECGGSTTICGKKYVCKCGKR